MPDFNINFFTLKISNPLKNKKQVRNWLIKIINKENKTISQCDISFIFCDDEYLFELNQNYLKKQTLTDVITFDYNEESAIKGDVFISYDRIKENAKEFRQKTQAELLRVMVHGILHLLGYKDKTKKDKRLMTLTEDRYLTLYNSKPQQVTV